MISAKMLINLTDVIVAKDTQQGASRLLTSLLETCVDRLHTMTVVHEEQVTRLDRVKKGEVDIVDIAFIENAKPVGSATYAAEKPEFVGQCLACGIALCAYNSTRESKSISHIPTWISNYSCRAEKMRCACTGWYFNISTPRCLRSRYVSI
jgi:hypothetical protein